MEEFYYCSECDADSRDYAFQSMWWQSGEDCPVCGHGEAMFFSAIEESPVEEHEEN